MFGRPLRWLSRKPTFQDVEIPHYPPFAKGLPAVPASRLLEKHGELVEQIHEAVMFKRSVFDELVMPVIEQYAAFVHLLPASESHHHRGAGGLLHHGLEVAFLATRASEDVLFAARETPKRRLELEPRWRLAVCMAGLIHDIGKPASDLSVTDSTGAHRWDCFNERISDWAAAHKIDRYFLHWQANRHNQHEMMSTSVIDCVLTKDVRRYLNALGPEVYKAMLSAVLNMGTDPGHIGRLIRNADSASVERDMRRLQDPIEGSLGVPVERYLLDTMRRLVKSGQWRINEKGARLWMLDGDLYVVWHAAAEEINTTLRDDRVPGVPRDPDSMADVLFDRALALPRETESNTYRFWPMRPALFRDGDPHRLMMLRLTSPELLLDTPPPSMTAEIIETRSSKKAAQSKTDEASAAQTNDEKVPAKPKTKTKPARKRQSQPTLAPASNTESVHDTSDAPEHPARATMASDDSMDIYDEWASQQHALDDESTDEQLDSGPAAPEATTAPVATLAKEQSPTPRQIQFDAGHAEGFLRAIYVDGKWDEHLFMHNDHVVIAYPEGAALAATPADVQRILADEGLVVPDPMSTLMIVRIFNARKGIMLDKRRSRLFLGETAQEQAEPEADSTTQAVVQDRPDTPAAAGDVASAKNKDEAEPAESDKPKATKNKRSRKRKKAPALSADEPKAAELQPEDEAADFIQVCVAALIAGVRDPASALNRRSSHEGDWIHVPQYVLGRAASDNGQGQVSIGALRSALETHADVKLIGHTKIAVRASPNG